MAVKFKGEKYDKSKGRFKPEYMTAGEKDKIWDKEFFFIKERAEIENWLRTEAQNFDPTKETVEDKWRLLEKEINSIFIASEKITESEKQRILDELNKNYYRSIAYDNKNKKHIFTVLLILSIIGEFAVLIVQALASGGFNPFILVYAGLLAVGGLLGGYFLGQCFVRSEAKKTGTYDEKEKGLSLKHWVGLVLGAVITLFLAWVRAVTEEGFDLQVFLLTILLALVVAFFEALRELFNRKYDSAELNQIKALTIYATERHKEWLNIYKDIFFNECVRQGKYKEEKEKEGKKDQSVSENENLSR